MTKKRKATPIADLMEREQRLIRIAEIVHRHFSLEFTEQQKRRFLETGTFCPATVAPIMVKDDRKQVRKGVRR